jgi:large subunit ribosomal protein L18
MSGKDRRKSWLGRKRRVRKKISGSAALPRLTVFRSGKHIYAQLIDDLVGGTLVAASSREKDFSEKAKDQEKVKSQEKAKDQKKSKGQKKAKDPKKAKGSNVEGAAAVGKLLGDRAKSKGVEKVVFDRNGFLFHGRVKALADAVRETGVKF